MSTRTVCDCCNLVVQKVGYDYTVIPTVEEADFPDLHTGRTEKTTVWLDVCIKCFNEYWSMKI